MGEMYDVFLSCHPKDYYKLPYVLKGIKKYLFGFDYVYIVVPEVSEGLVWLADAPMSKVCLLNEKDVLNIDKKRFKYRPGWQYQMYLKLFQQVTTHDWYFTLDCDVILLRPLPLWDGDRAIYWLGKNQYHKPYFDFQEAMGFSGRVAPFSFIADMNLFNKAYIDDMLWCYGYDRKSFIDTGISLTSKDRYLGEPELYGTYCYENRCYDFLFQSLSIAPGEGRLIASASETPYGREEIEDRISRHENRQWDIIALHSWYNEEA